ncbi:FKBP-type peptidyl-prolyl cis-trans isomerase [Roseivirga echinicomitans]
MMKKIKVLLSILAIGAITLSCTSDFAPSYDAAAQLAIDVAAIEDYIATNNLTVRKHNESEIRFIIDEEGNGTTVDFGNTVYVNYELTLLDSTFIDTNVEQTAKDNGVFNATRIYDRFAFSIGRANVVLGFDLATRLLTEGGSGRFIIPSVYAYQDVPRNNIPANSNLIFKITLLEVKK